jgi:CAAX prenyl protease-like protein
VSNQEATLARRADSGWVAYLAPYFAFLLIAELQARPLGEGSLVLWGLRVLLPAGLLIHFARRGAYPELRGFRFGIGGVAADIALGLVIAALWVVPFEAGWLAKDADVKGFDPNQLGPELRHVVLGLRLLGFAAVTPFVEELFVRSFLIRAAELVTISRKGVEIDFDADFRDVPMARFAWKGFVATVVLFTFSHLGWQWPAAFVTGIVWNLWLYHRGHIVPLVISHATANLALFVATVYASGRFEDATGNPLDLWYQL